MVVHRVRSLCLTSLVLCSACLLVGCGDDSSKPETVTILGTWDLTGIVETEIVPPGETPDERSYTHENFWFHFKDDGTGQKNTPQYGLETFTYTKTETHLSLDFDGISWEEWYKYTVSSSELILERDFSGDGSWHQVLTFRRR